MLLNGELVEVDSGRWAVKRLKVVKNFPSIGRQFWPMFVGRDSSLLESFKVNRETTHHNLWNMEDKAS